MGERSGRWKRREVGMEGEEESEKRKGRMRGGDGTVVVFQVWANKRTLEKPKN